MPWPTPQEYNEAIQHPALCFADAELRSSVPDVTSLGLPRPITGNFASVYRLQGNRDWAVRCFFREFADIGERYAAISAHLSAAHLPQAVGFQYLDRGIRVGSSWYPVLKMEWVEGELLGDFVAAHRRDTTAIRDLTERWLDMLKALEGRSIAHGDLQHGNVLIVGGDIRLVDYDGMFVPALAGRGSHEIGHPNYQHPARTGRDFAASIDHFSGWVVYLSLLALQRNPDLWDELGAGDECLLFRRSDFAAPQQSHVLTRLRADASLRPISEQLERIASVPPLRVPPVVPLDGKKGTSRKSVTAHASLPAWLEGAIPQPPPRRFAWPPSLGRAAGLATGCGVLVMVLLASLPVAEVGLLTVAAEMAVMWLIYLCDPSVLQRMRIRMGMVAVLSRRRAVLLAVEMERRRSGSAGTRHAAALAALARQRAARQREYETDVLLIERALGPDRAAAGERVRSLTDGRGETEERVKKLLRNRFADRRLRRRGVLAAHIQGVGIAARLHLWLGGVRNAKDVAPDRVGALNRLQPAQAAAVLRWKLAMDAEIHNRSSVPLPRHVTRLLDYEYSRARRRAERRQRGLVRRADRLQRRASQSLEGALQRIDTRIALQASRYAEKGLLHDNRIVTLNERVLDLENVYGRLEDEMDPLRDLTFRRYLSRVFGIRGATTP